MVEFPSREAALEHVAQWIPGLERVIRYLSTPPQYVLVIRGQQVPIGTIDRLLNQNYVRAQVADATGAIPEYIDPREGAWRLMAQAMLDAREDLEAPEAEEFDLLRTWIASYLEDRRPVPTDDELNFPQAHRMELPLLRYGEVLVNAASLARWVTERRGMVVPTRQIALLLRRYGARPVVVHHGEGSSRRMRRYWALPEELIPEGVGGNGAEGESLETDVLDVKNPSGLVPGHDTPRDDALLNAGGADGADTVQKGVSEICVQNAGGADGADGADTLPPKYPHHLHHLHHMAPGRYSQSEGSAPHLHHLHHCDGNGLSPHLALDSVQGKEVYGDLEV